MVEHVHPADDENQRRAEDRDRADHDPEERLLPRDGDPRVHRLAAGFAVALQLERFACEALHEAHRRERLVQPLEQLRFELLHALFAVDERGGVVAQAQIEERDDAQRQQRDGRVHLGENREHDDERNH